MSTQATELESGDPELRFEPRAQLQEKGWNLDIEAGPKVSWTPQTLAAQPLGAQLWGSGCSNLGSGLTVSPFSFPDKGGVVVAGLPTL